MMKELLEMLLLAGAVASCTSRSIPKGTADGTSGDSDHATCYKFADARDSIQMQLFISDSGIKGTLLYRIYEKDSNAGTFSGRKRGDTLLADYSFQSEGVSSVREVAFLVQGKELREGFGETETRGGKTVFKNPAALTFPAGSELKQVECSGSNEQ